MDLNLRTTQRLALVLAAGLLLGITSRLAHQMHGIWLWLGALGAPWLLVAFAIGATERKRNAAVALGAGALVAGVVTYYAMMYAVEGRASLLYALVIGLGWAALGAVGGAVFAAGGWAWRWGSNRLSRVGTALLCGTLIGEGIYALLRWQHHYGREVATAEVLLGCLMLTTARPRIVGSAAAQTAFVAVVFCSIEIAVAGSMHALGWGGA